MAEPRTLASINADISATAQRHKALIAERNAWLASRIERVCAAFDGNASPVDIARDVGMTPVAVVALLWRAGRTVKGRARLQQQRLHAIAERHAAVPQP